MRNPQYIPFKDFPEYVRKLAKEETPTALAARLGVSSRTIYNIILGAWPKRQVVEGLGMRLWAGPEPKRKKEIQ